MKKYNLKKFQILTALLAVIVVTSCGSSSAPPVDLPAPITGRVTISNPDADGNVSITSIAGAVDADAMVMTVNEEVAGTVSAKILNMLVKSAYAQTSFPSICDDDGYSCAVADADGVFEMTLAASFGDSIVIGVIDETAGEFISEVIRRVVGEVVETVVCADYDVSGAVVDVAVDPVSGGPIILKQGSDTATNQLVMGDSSPVTIPISGCFAHSIIVKEGTNGKPFIIVSSKDDQIIWSGTRSDNTIIEASTQETSDQPMHIAFPLYTNDAFVKASLTSDGYIRIDNISLTTLEQTASNDVSVKSGSSTSPLTDLSASVDLKIIDLDDGDIGVILVNSSYEEGLYLMLFDVESLSILETVTPEDFTSLQIGQASAVALYTDSGENVAIAILDSKSSY